MLLSGVVRSGLRGGRANGESDVTNPDHSTFLRSCRLGSHEQIAANWTVHGRAETIPDP